MVASKPIDFRKGIDGLVALVTEVLTADPFAGDVFVFRAKRTDRIKLILWDGSGLCMVTKRLEAGSFTWPPVQGGVMTLSVPQLRMLFSGMEAPSKYAPIFQRTDEGEVFAGPSALGFTTAMKLRWKAWEPLLDATRIECGLLLPIMLYSADQLAFQFDKVPQAMGAKSYLKMAYHDIPIVVPTIRDFWMPNRLAETK